MLDVCAGTGNVSMGLVEAGVKPHRITAMDISGGMLSQAGLKPLLAGVHLVQADAAHPPLRPEAFDLAAATLGLSNVQPEHWQSAVDGLLATLRPGGVFVLVETQRELTPGRQLERLLQEEHGGVTTPYSHNNDDAQFQLNYTVVTK